MSNDLTKYIKPIYCNRLIPPYLQKEQLISCSFCCINLRQQKCKKTEQLEFEQISIINCHLYYFNLCIIIPHPACIKNI